jgi:hypothetical protein
VEVLFWSSNVFFYQFHPFFKPNLSLITSNLLTKGKIERKGAGVKNKQRKYVKNFKMVKNVRFGPHTLQIINFLFLDFLKNQFYSKTLFFLVFGSLFERRYKVIRF